MQGFWGGFFSTHPSSAGVFVHVGQGWRGAGGEGLHPWSFGAVPQIVAKWRWDVRAPAPRGWHVTPRHRGKPSAGGPERGWQLLQQGEEKEPQNRGTALHSGKRSFADND